MSSDAGNDTGQASARRKGKGRATAEDISEQTPLLLGSSERLIQDEALPSHRDTRRRLYVLLSTVFLSSLCLCAVVLVILFFLAYSYSTRVSNVKPDELLDRALVTRGPSRIDVLNATEGTLWVQVEGLVGIDAGAALDTVLGLEDSWNAYRALQRSTGRWILSRIDNITVHVSEVVLTSGDEHGAFLGSVLPPVMQIPLTVDPPEDLSWLTPFSVPVRLNLTTHTGDLEAFVRDSWKSGTIDVKSLTSHVYVYGGSQMVDSWRRKLQVEKDDIPYPIHYKIPRLPGLPTPGKNVPFPDIADLVTLESFRITTRDHTVNIKANASVINPLPASLDIRIPSLPFIVSLPNATSSNPSGDVDIVPVVSGHSLPSQFTHPNISLSVTASLLAISHAATPILSSFVSNYLSGRAVPFVAGSPLLPALKIPMVFPAPHPKPQVLHDVAIRNMHISLNGEVVFASGTVYARVVLPLGIRLNLDVEQIWPDVLVFDGKVPDGEHTASLLDDFDHSITTHGTNRNNGKKRRGRLIPKPPLPDPLPEGAFARIRPEDWLDAVSIAIPITDNDGAGPEEGTSQYIVTAEVENVPLEVLPGRQRLMSNFVAKVLFGPSGALAGVQGTAAVAATVDGLPTIGEDGGGVIELTGLPFTGSFRVGKKGL